MVTKQLSITKEKLVRMSIRIKIVITVILLIAGRSSLSAQRIALTTNLVEDLVLTPNIGVDIVVSDKQSLTFDTSFAPYKLSQKFYNRRMSLKAGYKYWFKQAFYAHYVGFDALACSADIRVGKSDFKEEYVGVGVGYGYSFIIGKRLNIVPSVGVGVAYGQRIDGYDQMIEPGKGVEALATTGFMPMITRFAVTLQYVLK